MDIEKLIETLRQRGVAYVRAYGRCCSICDEVVTAITTLQAENEKLRAELERVKQERDVAVEYLRGQCRYCKRNLICTSRKGPHSNCWEWRGQKED